MTNTQIINTLAQEQKVEELIRNITKTGDITQRHLDDLSQDTYLSLLEKPPQLIEELYKKEQLIYYIARMLINNIHSSLSPYYYKYLKPEKHEDLKDNDKST